MNTPRILISSFALVLAAQTALAGTVNFSWSSMVSGTGVSGTAQFTTQVNGSGYDLMIVLTNNATTGPGTTAALLSGLYWDLGPGQGALTMSSALATGGLIQTSDMHNPFPGTPNTNICAPGHGGTASDPTCATTLPGGWEAGYYAAATGIGGTHYGIGTTGQSGMFNGNSTTGVDQANYSIAPGGGVGLNNPNTGVTNQFPYVSGTATFVLTGLTNDNIVVSNVRAAYGTAPEATPGGDTPNVPEPATIVEVAGGALLLAIAAWRRRRVPR